ncbi:MAG TPA: hypothetical protein VFP68_02465 [Burkholderiaceae bacterium]|nr:hypothetical protein [Burkholderiaceae bacterium]
MGTWLNRGASGGLAGASIERKIEKPKNSPAALPTIPELFTFMKADEAGPSRSLINNSH